MIDDTTARRGEEIAGSRRRRQAGVGGFVAVLVAGFAVIALTLAGPGVAQDRSQTVKTLRGDIGLEEPAPPPAVVKQDTPADGMFGRAYRQQPPLIPHRIETYQVTKDFNQCMTCHDWPANIKAGAPKVSETHYNDREGNRLDKVSGTRFFCTQCHVPQLDAKPLVQSTFQNATEVK
ncbi:Periplasmic nitrate reductase, electron transfer subunit [Rhodoplanes serenus]|uniref:Periplasmic nitrate reductase, electron transfer subunit n=1 Tax=Rhodoplanes serenus TaxID=200615 RepID=A0A3S4B2V2_9BRAD|nr:nitrate reductase cytochrome c-type subunit [Rhodoplanes serenus]VCU10275.1 Periplasmic nitrate reductase, electron transfer subunit [Rhodoplanes serenus]